MYVCYYVNIISLLLGMMEGPDDNLRDTMKVGFKNPRCI